MARLLGHIIDAGETRILWKIPPIEKPISWGDMINNHWSVLVKNSLIVEMKEASGDDVHIKLGCWL
jgi:hypothetical protein